MNTIRYGVLRNLCVKITEQIKRPLLLLLVTANDRTDRGVAMLFVFLRIAVVYV